MAQKDYFITYDIDPLANVSNFSTSAWPYAPPIISDRLAQVHEPGQYRRHQTGQDPLADRQRGRILRSRHGKGTDTVTGTTLQQKAFNQPILNFTLNTNVADAIWRWMIVYATGTVIKEATAANDVSAVKIWYDKDNNGFLGGVDQLIGSGVFGNTIFGPLAARVDIFTQRVITEDEALSRSVSRHTSYL